MISKKDQKKINELMEATALLGDGKEAARFFRDLLTEKELIEFGNRWMAARMLWKKESYVDIAKVTGLSSTTIARVSKWLTAGEGGYRTIIEKLSQANHHHSLPVSRKGLRLNSR